MKNKLLYAYICLDEECLEEFEEMRPMEERNNPINCPKCNHEAKRIFGKAPPRHVSWSQWNVPE